MTDINTSLASSGYLLSLFGTSSTSSAPTMSALAGYQPYVADENQKIETYSQQSTVQQDVTYFENNISKVKSVDDLTKDPKLLSFVTTAFGLDADAAYPAKIAAVLNSNVSDQSSYANSLIDPRYQQLAKEFNVASNGMASFSDSSVISDVVNRYLTNSYEESLDNTNPALRQAAYFLRNIGNIKSPYDILGDPVLRDVFETTTGLPATIANLPVDDEANLVTSKVDITQFETSGTSSSGASSTSSALTLAQSDLQNLSGDTAVVSAAQKSVQSVVDQITSIQTAYGHLSTIQSASGPYAAEIPVQEAAAPGLIQQQGLLASAQGAISTVISNLQQLQQLIQQAGAPNNTTPISTLQAEFTTLSNQITSAISGASVEVDNGTGGTSYTSENMLDGSMASAVTVPYDSKGDTSTVSPYNLGSSSAFQSQLAAATAAFQAVSGSSDGANIQTAASALASAQTSASVVSQAVSTQAGNFQNAVSSVPQWAGTYDSAQLYLGSQSVADAGSRITQVNQILSQIQQVAQQANQLPADAEHSSLQSQYQTLIGNLSQAIGQTTNPNVDNLLAPNSGSTPGYYSYSIDTAGTNDVQAQTFDFANSVLAPLQNLDVTSSANASSVMTAITGGIQTAVAQAGQQLAIDNQVFSLASTLDPRTAVDSQYRQLATSMSSVVSQAASNGQNLLDPSQASIAVTVSASNQTITIDPSDFDSEVTQVLQAGSQDLPSDGNDTTGALAQLSQAAFAANNILDTVNGQANQLQFATTMTSTKIAGLQKQTQTPTTAGVPSTPNAFAVQFVQKYLATVDAQNATTSGGDSYVVQLLQPTQSLDQTIGSLLTTTGGNLNISV
jgi:Protein of unknown function (DUF1217)